MILSNAAAHIFNHRAAFAASGAAALLTSGILFRDLADLSQWVMDVDRDVLFNTYFHRNSLAAASVSLMAANTAAAFHMPISRAMIASWAAVNGLSTFLLFSGYINPEIMMRPRNHNPLYLSGNEALNHVKREESVIVVQVEGDKPKAFPDVHILRPHVARVGTTKEGNPVVMTYCGLTNLGIAFETPNHPDGSPVELEPMTQLENNLVLADKSTGHVGHQINGLDETALLEKLGNGKSYRDANRKPSNLRELQLQESEVGKEVPTWRMTLGNFVRTYPDGEVFVNDYKIQKNWIKNPVKSIYDTLMDTIFETTVYFQATNPAPVFPTLKNIDPRLPPKEQVWAFDVDQDYVAITEQFVRDGPNGVRNMTVGNVPVVAAWDAEAASLGIWRRPSHELVREPISIHGMSKSGHEDTKPMSRIETVKNGAYWCVWANFFPQTRINPVD